MAELEVDNQQFDQIEKEFQEVLTELATDQSLERFRQEFDKLHRSLKISHENQRRLISKCRELNAEITSSASKIQTVLKMATDDQATIQHLKTELEKTFRILELSQEREEKCKQKIEILQNEMKQLNQAIEQGNTISSGQTSTVHELLQKKQELTKEREALLIQVANARAENQSHMDKIKNVQLDALREKSTQEYNLLIAEKNVLETQLQLDEKAKQTIQQSLEDIKKDYDILKNKSQALADEKRKIKQEMDRLHVLNSQKGKEIENQKSLRKQDEKDISDIQGKSKKKKVEEINAQLDGKIKDLRRTIENLESEIKQDQEEKTRSEMRNRELKARVTEALNVQQEAEAQKDLAMNGVNLLQDEIQSERKEAFDDRQVIEDLRRARNLLQKEIDRCENNNKKLQEDLIQKDKYMNEKRNELQGLSKKMELLNRKIQVLDKEKENYGLQFAQAKAKYSHSLDEIKLKDSLISEFQKKNIETEAKLKQQQNLYETVRSDRNLYSKKNTEKQQEIEEMRRRYKTVNHHISQYKEDIELKGNQLAKEHLEHKKKDKTIEEQAKILEKYKNDIDAKEKKIKTYLQEVSKLHFIIKESEQQQQKLKEEFDLVVAERDILSTQLIRRVNETQLLYEKIKINESTLKKGLEQYRERLGDIDMLKKKIADYKREISVFEREANTINDLQGDIHNLTKELTEEKLKAKALTEELENPMNVHRWRKLEATDSENYELMTKIHSLQRRLIQKTEEVLQKEKVVDEKEKDLKALKDEMKRKPGLEEQAMIPYYEDNLRQKDQQMRAMEQELNMYQSHINEYKLEISRLNKQELEVIKKRYFNQKKREQQQKDIQDKEVQQVIQVILPEKRFVGGGFALQK